VSRLLAGSDGDLQARARSELRRALAPHQTDRGLALVGATWIVTARA
jgi:hypothetical protein